MAKENWHRELQHLLGIFERESTASLKKISEYFLASGQTLDEQFRQHFLDMSTLK